MDYSYDEGTDTYTVYTVDGLLAWNEAVQDDSGINCVLAADMDLNGIEWPSIQSFSGNFDGQGHAITNLTVAREGNEAGFINISNRRSVIKNLTLVNPNIALTYTSYFSRAGAVVGSNGGTILNCHVIGGTVSSLGCSGGITGWQDEEYLNTGAIVGCSSSAEVFGSYAVGGIMGRALHSVKIEACWATGKVSCEPISGTTDKEYIGGITGDGGGRPVNCYWNVSGPIYCHGSSEYLRDGGIKVDDSTVTWNDAADAMNAYLSENGYSYKWVANTDPATSGTHPLVMEGLAE